MIASEKPWEDQLNKALSVVAIALALAFSLTANAATKKGDGAANAGATAGMHQPKKVAHQKRLRTICGSSSKMSGSC